MADVDESGAGYFSPRPTNGRCARAARRRGPSPGPPPPSSSARRRSSSPIRCESDLIASAIGSGRWIQSASGPSTRLPSTLTGWPGLPTTVAPGGTSSIDDRVGADLGAVADRDRAEQLGAGADGDVVAQGRVALAALEAGAAQRHPLVERHPLADLGRLADHDARAVVDEELAADPRRRVDLHPGHRRGSGRRAAAAAIGTPASSKAWARRWASSACTPPQLSRISRRRDFLRRGIAIARRGDVGAHLDHQPLPAVHGEKKGRDT